MHKQIGI